MHTSKSAKEQLCWNKKWANQSSDPNPIKHLWGDLKRFVHRGRPYNLSRVELVQGCEWLVWILEMACCHFFTPQKPGILKGCARLKYPLWVRVLCENDWNLGVWDWWCFRYNTLFWICGDEEQRSKSSTQTSLGIHWIIFPLLVCVICFLGCHWWISCWNGRGPTHVASWRCSPATILQPPATILWSGHHSGGEHPDGWHWNSAPSFLHPLWACVRLTSRLPQVHEKHLQLCATCSAEHR